MTYLKTFIRVSPKTSLAILCDDFRQKNGMISFHNYKDLEEFIVKATNRLREDFDTELTNGNIKAIERQDLEKNIFSVRKLSKKLHDDLQRVEDFNVMKPLKSIETNVWKEHLRADKAKKEKRKKLSFT